MNTPRFMKEYSNCIKRCVKETQTADKTTKALAVNRIDKIVRDYSRGMLGLVDAMDSIGSVLTAVKFYVTIADID